MWIVATIVGLSGLLMIFLLRQQRDTKLKIIAIIISAIFGFSSGLPFIYLGVSAIIKRKTGYYNHRGSSAVALGTFYTLIGLGLVFLWSCALTGKLGSAPESLF